MTDIIAQTAPRDHTAQLTSATDKSAGLAELAELINFRVGAWHDFGYAEPPMPECKAIPPLGERSAEAIKNGHEAVKDIDKLVAQLHALRGQLVSEMRQDEDIRAARIDALLAERKAEREARPALRPDQRAAALAIRMTRKSDGAR